MEQYYEIAKKNPLFWGMDCQEFTSILTCLGGFTRKYSKNQVIFLLGGEISYVGLVISGSVKITQEDIHANESILTEVGGGETFAEVFACAEIPRCPVNVIAREECEILFLNYKKVMETCNNRCVFHGRMIENLLKIVARKCLFLNQKVDILSKRTTREKVLSFLLYRGKGSKTVKIELNREEMANFICVDRSALSAELSKMQKEEILLYRKNEFQLL